MGLTYLANWYVACGERTVAEGVQLLMVATLVGSLAEGVFGCDCGDDIGCFDIGGSGCCGYNNWVFSRAVHVYDFPGFGFCSECVIRIARENRLGVQIRGWGESWDFSNSSKIKFVFDLSETLSSNSPPFLLRGIGVLQFLDPFLLHLMYVDRKAMSFHRGRETRD